MIEQNPLFYKQLFELSNDALLIIEGEKIIQCNPACVRILRADSSDQILLSHPSEISPPFQKNGVNSWELSQKFMRQCYEEGFIQFDWIHRRLNGEDFPAEVTLTSFELAGRKMIYAIIRDISEWTVSETARKDAEDRLRFIADNSEDIIWMRDLRFRYTYLSPSVVRVKGFTVEEALKLRATETAHREDVRTAFGALQEELQKENQPGVDPNRSRRFQMREYKKDGSIIWTEQSMSFIRDSTNKPIGIMGITRDISEHIEMLDDLKVAKEKAEESDKLKSSFLANMSHEVRTPLNAILGFSELLADEQIDAEEKSQFATIIRKSSNNLLSIISDIFDISKIETHQIELFERSINLKTILASFNDFKDSLDPDVSGDVMLQIDSIPDYLDQDFLLDQDRISQVIKNLIDNAFKFTNAGIIHFGAQLIGQDKVRIYIKDCGPGIKEDTLQVIFERFRQAHESLDRQYGGTGLGLAICKGLVEMMQGEIGVISEDNQGSEFWFTIPLKKP